MRTSKIFTLPRVAVVGTAVSIGFNAYHRNVISKQLD